MSLMMEYTICDSCGHVYKFYPGDPKIFCPKCMAKGPGNETGPDAFSLKLKSLAVKNRIRKEKKKKDT